MKRVLMLTLVGLLFGSLCLAQDQTAVQEYSYCIRNNTPTSKTTVIPTTSIRPNIDKLTAYVVMPIEGRVDPILGALACEVVIGVFDGTDVLLTGEKLGEKEAANSAGSSAGERFDRPKKIVNGLVVQQGAFSIAIIYFIRE